MQLTKLEIKGFKSFGEKVIIHFDKGITGIVGPNGCGKSNIVDAIRWVLGEQKTKTLRSDKMENVIFNGTKNRKPAQLAEVSLTFDNTKNILPTEYTQVTVTRRYYRSGDSEYQLNGVPCRLKDINSLFMDTGIASNSYAIIELKMVDEILNDKDNARRGLFEEAAGISKFKTRKKQTLKKLEDTDADLDRVEDLLYEIQKNLKSLEKQAKQAEKYFQLKKEYKKYSVFLGKKSLQTYSDSLIDINKSIDSELDKKSNFNAKIKSKEASSEEQKKQLLEKEKLLASRQKTLNEHVNKIREIESNKKITNERLRFLHNNVNRLQQQIELDESSNQRINTSIKSLENEKNETSVILATTEKKVIQLQESYNQQKNITTQLQQQLKAENESFRVQQQEVHKLSKDIEVKQMQLVSFTNELGKIDTSSNEKSQDLESFNQQINTLSAELEEKREQLKKLKLFEEDILKNIDRAEKAINDTREAYIHTERTLDANKNEYNLTKSLVDNLEGFPEAIKFLKKNANWCKDAPLLSDILTCHEKYRATIENYLEPYLNYYVVNTASEAFQAINLLSDAAKGRAHFFVLEYFDKIKSSPIQLVEHAMSALDIVEYDDKYEKLIKYLLDQVYIVADEKNIPHHENLIFITQNSKVIKKAFAISGGAVGLFEGKRIGRAKNLKKLELNIQKLEKQLQKEHLSLNTSIEKLEELKKSLPKNEIETLQKEINQHNEIYISLKTKKEQFQEIIGQSADHKQYIQNQIDKLSDELKSIEPQAITKEKTLKDTEQNINQLNAQLLEQNELLTQQTTLYNQENLLYHQQQNKIKSIEQEISFKQNTLDRNVENIQKNQLELKSNNEEVKRIITQSNTNEDELIDMYDEKEQLEKGVNEAEKNYYRCRGNIDTLQKEIRELQHAKESIDTLLQTLQNKLNEIKLQQTALKERLSVEFEIDSIKLVQASDDDASFEALSEEELKEKVVQIKNRLDKIGPINPMAMEAYEEIKERHQFISTQKEDLLKAKQSLLTTIAEIDTVAKETFLKAFYQIKANFKDVFRSLFTEEDDCDLTLTDPQNPLESSIEIMAKPKGKRPLTINQLSGGEKTLTATSLLFSIYLLKPAPFCIFDEVDAPLDDANIDKFNNIIKNFSKESQFIIVTHNKRTMSSTDIIYGITMVEQGISKVVPVDLRALA